MMNWFVNNQKRCLTAALLLAVSVLLEIFIFNARSFEEIGNPQPSVAINISAEEMALDESGKLVFEVRGKEKLPSDVRSVRLEFPDSPNMGWVNGVVHTEETGLLLGHDREFRWMPEVEHSRYVYLFPGTRPYSVRFYLEDTEPQAVRVIFNDPVPLRLDPLRLLLLLAVLSGLYFLRPQSNLWRKRGISERDSGFWLIFAAFALFLVWTDLSTYSDPLTSMKVHPQVERNSRQQYELLTESLYHGSLSILEDPPAELSDLENPYDCDQRTPIIDDVLWDVAYYNGRYYVYYGIVPALLLLLPIRALFGSIPPLDFVVLFYGLIGTFGLLYIYRIMVRRWFGELPRALVYLGTVPLLLGSCLICCVRRPLAYETALTASFAHVTLGAALLLAAVLDENHRGFGWRGYLGCILLALAVGCRPTALFVSLLLLPLLPVIWEKCDKKILTMAKTLFFCALPYVIVGIGLALYNYLRFGSFFEFGQNYNLSTYDNRVVSSGLLIPQSLMSVFNYVFGGGIQLISRFPFVKPAERILFDYGGTKYFNDIMPVLALCPWVIMVPLAAVSKTLMRGREKLFRCLFAAFALIPFLLAAFTGTAVGLLQRYALDFYWLFILDGLLAFFLLYSWLGEGKGTLLLNLFFAVSVLVCIFFSGHLWVGEANHEMQSWIEFNNPLLFEKLNAFFAFWF